jgi:hypothetical protein
MRDWRFLLKVRLGSLIHSQDAAGEFGNMHRMIPNKALNLSCPGFPGQLIRRHFNGLVLHGRLIIQRLMKSFTIVKQFDVLKDFVSCFIPRLKVAVVNEFIL